MKEFYSIAELYSDYEMCDILACIGKYGIYLTDEVNEKILSDPEYRIEFIEELKKEQEELAERRNEEKIIRTENRQKDMLIFNSAQLGELSKYYRYVDDFEGYFYVLECGEQVKIGSTKNPEKRLKTLYNNFDKYGNIQAGRFAISQAHSNFRKNEKILHSIFEDYRVRKTELFKIDFDSAVSIIKNSELEYKIEDELFSMEKIQPFLNIAIALSDARHNRSVVQLTKNTP